MNKSKSKLIRVDRDFAKTITKYKIDMTRVVGKPVTGVEVTKILNGKLRDGILSGKLVSSSKRRKKVFV